MSYIWSRTDGASGPSISIVFDDGEIANVNASNPELDTITQKLAATAPDQEIHDLLSPVKAIALRLQRLSERVTTDGSNLFFDGDAVHDTLADYILKLVRLEADQQEAPSWRPFVHFLERLAQNPNVESRESLYTFIERHGLTIRPNGDFIAYKGVKNDFGSIRTGPGIVDNVPVNGSLMNKPGSILEMQRSVINSDSSVGCAVGLHVGTANFASGWGPTVVAVAVNPRDVVSVPQDHNFQKIRVARYEVLTKISAKEKVKATVGEGSAPVWTDKPDVTLDEEILRKLKKAIKKNHLLKVRYTSRSGEAKKYVISPTEIKGNLVVLELPKEEDAIRSFRIDRIKSVKKFTD